MEAIISAVDPILFVLILIAFLCFLIFGSHKPTNGYPPGPWGLPIVGNLLQLGSSPHIALTKMSKIYGNVFSVKFGSREAVVFEQRGSGQRSPVAAPPTLLQSTAVVHAERTRSSEI